MTSQPFTTYVGTTTRRACVVGYRDLPKLLTAIEHELHGSEETPMIDAA